MGNIAILCPGQKAGLSQVDIVRRSICSYQFYLRQGIVPTMIAGLSLGEFTALYFARIIEKKEDLLALVEKRQELMKEACQEFPGKMVVIRGLDILEIEAICDEVGNVWPTNFLQNQIVISGLVDAVDKAEFLAQSKGARNIELNTKGPFHTRFMQKANEKFSVFIQKTKFQPPAFDFYSSVSGEKVQNYSEVKELLTQQMTSNVLWAKVVESLVRDGAKTFIEVEPVGSLAKIAQKSI